MKTETPELNGWRRGTAVFLTLLVALWGIAALYSVTALTGDPGSFLLRQCGWLILGTVLMLTAALIPYDCWRKWCSGFTIAAWAALTGVLLAGRVHHGMYGWYEWHGITIQPSELAKPFFCLLAAKIAAADRSAWRRMLTLCGCGGGYLLLILLEPDFGTAAVYLVGLLLTLWLGNFRWYYPVGTVAVALPAVMAAAWRHPYVLNRFAAFLCPGQDPGGAGWHLHQFELCFARGGWFGVKQTAAAWSSGFLPLAHNDSIFAAIGEVLGGFGLVLLLLLLVLWIGQLIHLEKDAATPERRLFIDLAAGMTALQALLHIYVNLGLLPPTGITLPLVSYGGSSLIGTMLMTGMILSAAHLDPASEPEWKIGG